MFSALTFLGIFEPEAFFTSRAEALSRREKKIHWKMLVVMSFRLVDGKKNFFLCFLFQVCSYFASVLRTFTSDRKESEVRRRKLRAKKLEISTFGQKLQPHDALATGYKDDLNLIRFHPSPLYSIHF